MAASDQAENASGPITGSNATLPKVMLSPVNASKTKHVAVIQCTKRSKALKRTMLMPERPDLMRTMPRIRKKISSKTIMPSIAIVPIHGSNIS